MSAPFIAELLRKKLRNDGRDLATGQFVYLSQGITYLQWFGPKKDQLKFVFTV